MEKISLLLFSSVLSTLDSELHNISLTILELARLLIDLLKNYIYMVRIHTLIKSGNL